MSKIQEMIERMCPEGVEYKTIKETVGLNRGSRLTKSQLSDDGRYVYASNRGHDSIATYEINEDGKLHFLSHGKCSAKEIRSFTLLADNRILIAGQSSDNLVCCEVNSLGRIGRQMSEIRIPRPVCVVKG